MHVFEANSSMNLSIKIRSFYSNVPLKKIKSNILMSQAELEHIFNELIASEDE